MSGAFARFKSDLPLFALLQLPWLALAILLAKVLAARHAYPSAPPAVFLPLLFRSLAYDFLTLLLAGGLILASRSLRAPDRLRGPAVAAIHLAFASLAALCYLDAFTFVRFGAPLGRDLVEMLAPMFAHSAKVMSFDEPLLRLAIVGLVWPLLLTAVAWPRASFLLGPGGRWSGTAYACVAALGLSCAAAFLLPGSAQRERTLRRIAPIVLVLPEGDAPKPVPLGPAQEKVLTDLLGGVRKDGVAAFEALPRRKRNVVFWVWESVGERYLKSHHPLGRAASPVLDRLAARGSVRFANTFVDCPLSAQSTFTLVTGMSPPANPGAYRTGLPLPRTGPYLPAVLREQGYETAFLNSSYLDIWGEIGFLREAGFDVLEDARSLANRDRFKYQEWSIEGRALVDRFFQWRDGKSARDPFFAVLWNVETHFHYEWIGMPEAMKKDDDLTRYLRAIEYTDRLLGELFDGLAARGLDRDTLIVVVGDHGQGLGRGDQPYDRFESLLVREDDIQVPLVFLHPEIGEGVRVVETPANLADVYATALDLVGLPVPGVDGRSLAAPYTPRVMVARAATWWPLSARAGPYKLVVDHREDPPELYHTGHDPWEVDDISGRHPEVTEALWAFLGATTERRAREDPSFALFSAADWKRF